jgi:hypothetical protein
MTPTAVRKKIESLARERDLLMAAVNEVERRSDALTEVLREKRRRLVEVIMQLNECTPTS